MTITGQHLPASNEYYIKIPDDFSDKSWADSFGYIQPILLNGTIDDQSVKKIIISFTSTRWADPTPLMSLALSIYKFAVSGGQVYLKFSKINENANKFLKFLSLEGFMNLFAIDLPQGVQFHSNCGNGPGSIKCIIDDKEIDATVISDLNKLAIDLTYKNAHCLPVQFFQFHNEEFKEDADDETKEKIRNTLHKIDQRIEQCLEASIEPCIVTNVPTWAHSGIIHRLEIFCREAIHNIVEHAYQKETGGNFSNFGCGLLYIRYRRGQVGASIDELQSISFCKNREDDTSGKLVPKLPSIYLSNRTGFFEVFVVDIGQGITNSHRNLKDQIYLNSVMTKVLSGFSRRGIRDTEYGGIRLLRDLSELTSDCLRVYDNGEWWGTQLPLPLQTSQAHPIEPAPSKPQGLAWTGRLSWCEHDEIGAVRDWRSPNQTQKLSIQGLYKNKQIAEPQNGQIEFIDLGIDSKTYTYHKSESDKITTIFLVPPKRWMKNTIVSEIKKISLKYRCLITLFICDIDPQEAPVYLSAIINAKAFTYQPLAGIHLITIITNTMHFSQLIRKYDAKGGVKWTFSRSDSRDDEFINPYNFYDIISNLKPFNQTSESLQRDPGNVAERPNNKIAFIEQINSVNSYANHKLANREITTIILSPQKGFPQNKIINEIKNISSGLPRLEKVFICNVDPQEAHLYLSTLFNTDAFTQEPLTKILCITIVTSAMNFSQLIRCYDAKSSDFGNFSRSVSGNNRLINDNIEISINSIYHYIYEMRTLDTLRFWE